MSDAPIPRYDLLIVPQKRGLALPHGSARALVGHIAVTRIGRPVEEAVAEKWVEVYMEPGPSAHEAFIRGGYSDPEPVFLEMAARIGSKPVSLDYGIGCESVCVFLEIRGSRFETTSGHFLKKITDIMQVRFDVLRKPHQGLPEHLEVPEDEVPKDKRKRKGAGPGVAGTHVEEW